MLLCFSSSSIRFSNRSLAARSSASFCSVSGRESFVYTNVFSTWSSGSLSGLQELAVHKAACADRRSKLRKRLGAKFTLHGLWLCALDGHFDLALVCQESPGGFMRGFLLLQLLLQHLQLVGQINLFVALLLQEKRFLKNRLNKTQTEHNIHNHKPNK